MSSPKSSDSTRLDAQAWIDIALTTLATEGVDAVRVEPLAKKLGVTKGSFYWHFKDRPALLEDVIASWRHRSTLAIIDRLEHLTPVERLKQLMALPRHGMRSSFASNVESAIRLWAKKDERVADAVTEIDGFRLRHIESLLAATDLPAEEKMARATLIYSFILAEAMIGGFVDDQTFAKCEAILLKL